MTTMSISQLLKVGPRLPAWASVLLRADHGLGKSQVVRQLAKVIGKNEKHKDYPVLDRRLSQMSEGDMIGLPSTDGETTRFNPPAWYMNACKNPVVLFLDELNRATPEVMQAAFQIVLDRELNGHKLHPQTRVYTAINTGASYSVNEVDPALLDRFFVVDLAPSVSDWLTWANKESEKKIGGFNVNPLVSEFIQSNDKWLDTPKNADPSKVHPSRRSWERVSDTLEAADLIDNPDQTFYNMTVGFVGTEAGIAFRSFAKNYDAQVSGKDIVEKFNTKRIKKKMDIELQGQEGLNACIDKVSNYIIKELNALDDRQGKNVRAFMEMLPGELRTAFWSKLTAPGIERIELAKSIHKHCADLVLGVFGVPMGEAGIGVVPNIPGIFKNGKDNK